MVMAKFLPQLSTLSAAEVTLPKRRRRRRAPDLVFGAGFFGVLFEGERDETVDQFAEGDAAGFPELGIHADGSEAGDGVHFVEIDLSALLFQEEIDAGHAAQLQGAKGGYGQILKFFDLGGL